MKSTDCSLRLGVTRELDECTTYEHTHTENNQLYSYEEKENLMVHCVELCLISVLVF